MSVSVTSKKAAALYCNTTDKAFGPIFGSAGDAWEFLEWLEKTHHKDARDFSYDALVDLQCEWEDAVSA